MSHSGSVLGGALLVAGTAIGGGMLALPVVSGLAGFIPAVIVALMCWGCMLATGLLYVEVCLSFRGGDNLISLASKTLGKAGKLVTWIVYLFFFYCLMTAYTSEGGNFLVTTAQGAISPRFATVFFVVLFGCVAFCGTKIVDHFNKLLMIGLFASFVFFFLFGTSYIRIQNLSILNWKGAIYALPVMLASFGFQGIIPSLAAYLDYSKKKLIQSIVIGCTLPLVVYISWLWLVLGIVPLEGEFGILDVYRQGGSAIVSLKYYLVADYLNWIGQAFGFFALVTSFVGVSLGLIDFLGDGLKIPRIGSYRLLLCCLVFLPPLAFSISYPYLFLKALNIAGGYGSALLLGLLPVAMVWSLRYSSQKKEHVVVPGGKIVLLFIVVFILLEMIFQLMSDCHIVTPFSLIVPRI